MKKIFYVHLFHILFIGWLFLYVGIMKTSILPFMYQILLILGLFLVLYHSFKAFILLKSGKNPWINLFHIFIIAPLLIYIGWKGKNTNSFYFELLLMLGFASVGYHGYYLFLDGFS